MAIVISVFLQKGGCGKTTTSLNFSAFAGKDFKRKVLLIDIDGQANASLSSGIKNPELTIKDVLTDNCNINEAIIKCKYYDMLASDADVSITELGDDSTILKRKLEEIKENYDYIVIDCPPGKNDLTANALVASNTIIVPVESSIFSLNALKGLSNIVYMIQNSGLNDELYILGILIVKAKLRTIIYERLSKQMKMAAEAMGTKLFNSKIRTCTAIECSQALEIPLPDYGDRYSNARKDYKAFVTEAIKRLEEI